MCKENEIVPVEEEVPVVEEEQPEAEQTPDDGHPEKTGGGNG